MILLNDFLGQISAGHADQKFVLVRLDERLRLPDMLSIYLAAWIVVIVISYVGTCKRMDFTRWALLGLIGSATIWVLIEIGRRSRGVPESLFVAIHLLCLMILSHS